MRHGMHGEGNETVPQGKQLFFISETFPLAVGYYVAPTIDDVFTYIMDTYKIDHMQVDWTMIRSGIIPAGVRPTII